jgi:hypothetical protein
MEDTMADKSPYDVYNEIQQKLKAGQPVTEQDTAALNYAQYLESNRSSRRGRITDAISKIYTREWRRHAAIKNRLNQWQQHSNQDAGAASQQNRLAGMVRHGQAAVGSLFRLAARGATYGYHKISSTEARNALMKFHAGLGTTAAAVRSEGVHISERGLTRALTNPSAG